jgi:hypothetical protein
VTEAAWKKELYVARYRSARVRMNGVRVALRPWEVHMRIRKRAAVAAATAMLLVGCGGPPEGTKSFQNLSRRHVEHPVHYEQSPPVGGKHAPFWQDCGFYSKPIRNENAVHSMEHGAVWITYRPGLPEEQVDKLRQMAQNQTHILISPYPDQPSPVVASAWGEQLRLDSAADSRLEQFVSAFQRGPHAPEPDAPCTGGRSATVSEP